ncbi:DUF692 domain-containing protein [Agaribacter marinus]|uniref:UPF0276 protein n=1 Tax=Agaribacter marinus TaxID=1431249 RepID=A0AA37WIF9_9ALTE|nr:DUF692 domain-containing protein [Agaribacter marinus]GLR70967.1 UPF0276 protein [Agaribacter marinus]
MKQFVSQAMPNPFIGVGLRHPHYEQSLSHNTAETPIDFVEIHAENFFADGGISIALLEDVCEKYALSVHGTSLGLGSAVAVPNEVLEKFARLIQISQPAFVSEHLCFNRARLNEKVVHTGDLLPIPYNIESLKNIVSHIQQVQDKIRRPILIENLSAYLSPEQISPESLDSMSEVEFLVEMCSRAGCGLLLDLNNLIVNALNQDIAMPIEHILSNIRQLPSDYVGEIHLAGYTEQGVNGFIVDDHGAAVSNQCWDLYTETIALFGNKPTLIEWDTQLPDWYELVAQTEIARSKASI